jgi:hypothetical protein
VVLRGLLLVLSVLAVAAPAAVAQDDEVFVDPGSPSGKEYALPVDSARKQAAKDAQKGSARAQPAPLFGEGVGDTDAASTSSAAPAGGGGSGSGGDRRRAAGDDSAPGAAGGERASAAPATLKSQVAAPDGGLGLVTVLAAGLAVLALGGAIGLLLRRRATRAS